METTKIIMFMFFFFFFFFSMFMYFYVTRWLCYVVEIFLTKLLAVFLKSNFFSLIIWFKVNFIHFSYAIALDSLKISSVYQASNGEQGLILYSSTILKIWDLFAFSYLANQIAYIFLLWWYYMIFCISYAYCAL